MATNYKAMKLPPPGRFKGLSTENFDEWGNTFALYITMHDGKYWDDVEWSLTLYVEITIPQVLARDQDLTPGTTINFAQARSAALYSTLYAFCEGTAKLCVDSVPNINELEAWRRLNKLDSKSNTQVVLTNTHSITNAKFPEENLEAAWAKWEMEITKYEAAARTILPDSVKASILVCRTSGKLYESRCTQCTDLTNYATVRAMVIHHIQTKALHMGTKPNKPWRSDPNAMDTSGVYAFTYGRKGKGGKKGKGKGKGKPQGKGDSKGKPTTGKPGHRDDKGGKGGNRDKYYHYCNRKGHNTSECWNKPKKVSTVNYDEEFPDGVWVDDGWGSHYWWEPEDDLNPANYEPSTHANSATASTSMPLGQSAIMCGQCLDEDDDDPVVILSVKLDFDQKINKDYALIGKIVKHYTEDRRMIDSGAQCCVCTRDYAPEISTKQVPVDRKPNLRTATIDKMHVYGLKYVHDQLSRDIALRVKYYVCEVQTPILSVSSMVKAGYSVVLDNKPHVKLHNRFACPLSGINGFNYIKPLSRSEIGHHQAGGQTTTPQLIAMAATNKDYWMIGGDKAISVHNQERIQRFVPSLRTTKPGSNDPDDPELHRLGDERITEAWIGDDKAPIRSSDNWKERTDASIPEKWRGQTTFYYSPASKEPTVNKDVTMPDVLEHFKAPAATTNNNVDYWINQGSTWARYRILCRKELYPPTMSPDGLDLGHLEDKRVTTKKQLDGTTDTVEDNWRENTSTSETLWTGTTVFLEKASFPQIIMNDCVDEVHAPKALPNPVEPIQQERELHNLTHMPYRSWCSVCVGTKGRGDYRKQVYDKKPVIQVDYAFIVDKKEKTDDEMLRKLSRRNSQC